MINKKNLFKTIIIIALIITIIIASIQITKTLARYETVGTAERNVDVAFWAAGSTFQTENITLSNLYPSETPFEYTFSVSNFNEAGKRAETDIEYDITIVASTYLPLSYDIVKKEAEGTETVCTKTEQLYTDDNNTYYRQINFDTSQNNFTMDCSSDRTDTFVIKITFPKKYSANPEYAGSIECIKINLSARQVIK